VGRTRWDFDLAETAGAIAIALILVGLLLRNLVDATTSADVVRAFGGVTILALLFGYRFVSHRLDEQASGVLLLFVGGLVFFQGENPAVYGGREADNYLTFYRRLQAEYPTTTSLY
jgi:hypothetical protein